MKNIILTIKPIFYYFSLHAIVSQQNSIQKLPLIQSGLDQAREEWGTLAFDCTFLTCSKNSDYTTFYRNKSSNVKKSK